MSTATKHPKAKCTLLAIAGLLALSRAAESADWSFGVDAGIAQTDNITLTSSNRVSQTTAIADLDFALKQRSLRFDTTLTGNFSFLDFLQHAYGSELVGRFDGLARLALLTDRLTWTVQDNFGQGQLNAYGAPTPANRENIDVLSTGPDWTLRYSRSEFVTLSARYIRAQYQTSPFNSNSALLSAAWGVDLSARSKLMAEATNEHVSFDNTIVNTNFDRTSGFAHYELHGARTDLVTSIGATVVTRAHESAAGPMLTVDMTRSISANVKLTLSAGRILTDASSTFSSLQSGAIGSITTAPAAQTSADYTSNYASLGWRWQSARTTVSVSGRWEEDSYEGPPAPDNTRSGGETYLEHSLTRALSAQLYGSFYYTDYTYTNVVYYDFLAGAGLVLRTGRDLEFRLRYNHDSRLANLTGSGFAQNFAFLTIGYRPSHNTFR